MSSEDVDDTSPGAIRRIAQCTQQYSADQTNILIMVQPSYRSCLQTLQYSLLAEVVSNKFVPLTAIAAQARLSVAAYRKDPVAIFTASSRQGIPNIIVCRSCCDALSLLTNLLDQTDHVIPQTISPVPVDQVREPMKHRPLPGSQRPGREEMDGARDQWSSWLLIAISSNTGPLLSTQECCQLKRELRTIKNNCLASSSQFRHSCRLRDSVAMLLEGFFETDQPL